MAEFLRFDGPDALTANDICSDGLERGAERTIAPARAGVAGIWRQDARTESEPTRERSCRLTSPAGRLLSPTQDGGTIGGNRSRPAEGRAAGPILTFSVCCAAACPPAPTARGWAPSRRSGVGGSGQVGGGRPETVPSRQPESVQKPVTTHGSLSSWSAGRASDRRTLFSRISWQSCGSRRK
jgi:hypothetical protein